MQFVTSLELEGFGQTHVEVHFVSRGLVFGLDNKG